MTDRCFQELLPSTSYIKGRIWSTSASMDVLSCNTSSHFPCWQRTLESDIWCANWESTLAQVTWYNQWVADICLQSFSNLPYTLEEWYGTLQQQWMSFLAVQHPILRSERVSKILHFVYNLRVSIGRKCTVWPIRRCQMLSEAHWIYLIHQRKIMSHFKSNGCPYLHRSIPFPVQRGYPKSGGLYEFESQPRQK